MRLGFYTYRGRKFPNGNFRTSVFCEVKTHHVGKTPVFRQISKNPSEKSEGFMPCVDGKDAFLSGFVASFIFVSNTLHCFQQLIDRIETPALIRIGSFIPKPFYRPIFLALYIRFSSENKITESS